MDKDEIIQKTVYALSALPEEKAQEIANFADFILRGYEEQILQKGLCLLQSDSNVFNFLNEDEELYSTSDIKQ